MFIVINRMPYTIPNITINIGGLNYPKLEVDGIGFTT